MNLSVLNLKFVVIIFSMLFSIHSVAKSEIPPGSDKVERISTEPPSEHRNLEVDSLRNKLELYRQKSVNYEIEKRELEKKIELDALLLKKAQLDQEIKSIKIKNSKELSLSSISNIGRRNSGTIIKSSKAKRIQLISMYEIDSGIYADFIDETSGNEYKEVPPNEIFSEGYSYSVVKGTIELRYHR